MFTQTKFRIAMMILIRSSFEDNEPKEDAVPSLAMESKMIMPDLEFLLLLSPVHITHVVRRVIQSSSLLTRFKKSRPMK